MPLDIVPWLGVAGQIAGAILLAVSGGFGFDKRKYSARGTAAGLAVFCAACLALAFYAMIDRNYVMVVAELLAGLLVGRGVLRKTRDRRDGE